MTSKTDIYNMALRNMGSSERVEQPTEASKPARICSDFYDQVLDYVLQDGYWSFCTRAAELALVDEEFIGWTYVYAQPDDCIFVRRITDSGGARLFSRNVFYCDEDVDRVMPRVPFKLVASESKESAIIATDLSDAYAIYTARVTVPNVWGASFVEALAYRLAAKIAPAMKADTSVVSDMYQLYILERNKALANDLNQQQSDPEPDSPSITIRA